MLCQKYCKTSHTLLQATTVLGDFQIQYVHGLVKINWNAKNAMIKMHSNRPLEQLAATILNFKCKTSQVNATTYLQPLHQKFGIALVQAHSAKVL